MGGVCGDDQNPYCDLQVSYAPAEFCCKEETTCLLVAANTTVICCPPGRLCRVIEAISCDLNLLQFPSEIQSTFRQGNLTECNNGCCPWGYFCNTGNNCELAANQAEPPPGAEVSSSKTSSTSHPISSSTSSSTSPPTTSSTTPSTTPSTPSSYLISTSSTTSDTFTTISTTRTTYSSSYETSSITPSVGPLPESNQTANQPGATPSTNRGTWVAIGSCLGVSLLVLIIYSILRVRKSTKKSRDDRDQNNENHGYPVGASVYDQRGENEPKSPEHPANPYPHQAQLDSSNVYELSG
ncbi:hypothetical protein K449DRAFT_466236 [Hypoxylon sp. EC38]|nr:hypothetical protein K449DRAFT_466236 [Hypoxylon sp. EC38]